jgi:transposase-like protein
MAEVKRKAFAAAFNAKVGLEAIRGVKTVNEIGKACGVQPAQVGQWWRQIQDQAETLFAKQRGPKKADGSGDVDHLNGEIGRLKVELDWLEKVRAEPVSARRAWIERPVPGLAVSRQCLLAGGALQPSARRATRSTRMHSTWRCCG